MKISSPSRKTSVRKPSHFGSKIQPSPSGSALTRLASIGSTGGLTGKSIFRSLPTTVVGGLVLAADVVPPRPLRIWAKRTHAQNSTSCITVDAPLSCDNTLWRDTRFHPTLERAQHAALRRRVRAHPLPKIVGRLSAA